MGYGASSTGTRRCSLGLWRRASSVYTQCTKGAVLWKLTVNRSGLDIQGTTEQVLGGHTLSVVDMLQGEEQISDRKSREGAIEGRGRRC